MTAQGTGGISAPASVGAGATTVEVTVDSGASTIYVSTDKPNWWAEYTVGADNKVAVSLPAGIEEGTTITITDDRIPPNQAVIEVTSTSGR